TRSTCPFRSRCPADRGRRPGRTRRWLRWRRRAPMRRFSSLLSSAAADSSFANQLGASLGEQGYGKGSQMHWPTVAGQAIVETPACEAVMAEVSIGIVKLLLGVLAFVLVGWLGARDKRIGGVLLTFPLLNGIAMLTEVDPVGIAGTIYLIVIWNCILFLVAIHRYDRLPPLPAGLNEE